MINLQKLLSQILKETAITEVLFLLSNFQTNHDISVFQNARGMFSWPGNCIVRVKLSEILHLGELPRWRFALSEC